jgi:hypothetical protein
MAVGIRVDGDGGDAGLRAGAYDANGDFATIGDQDFLDQVEIRVVWDGAPVRCQCLD